MNDNGNLTELTSQQYVEVFHAVWWKEKSLPKDVSQERLAKILISWFIEPTQEILTHLQSM